MAKSGTESLASAKKLRIAVLGTPEHEGRMCGRAFDILGVVPIYLHPSNPVLPSDTVPDVVLLSREWSVDVRHAAIQARRKAIPVVYLTDGVIEWDYFWHNWGFVKPEGTILQPLIASDLCVIGQHPARILAALGLAEKIHIVGLPRLDDLKRRRVIDRDQARQIFVATAKTVGHNTAHKVYIRAALRDLKDWFDGHPEVIPMWWITEDMAAELGVVASNGGTIVDALGTASGVVAFTSTVLLEAMRIGVPTAQIDYRTVPQYVQTAWEIRSVDHIEAVIRELMYPPPEKMAFQESCLMDELELGDASERLANVIRRIALEQPSTEASPTTSKNGLLDFRQVHSHLSAFTVSPMTRLQYELDATYKLWERDRESVAKFRGAVDELCTDPLFRLIKRLDWMPGFRRAARLIGSIAGQTNRES